MATSVLILTLSVVLFAYWFRHSCLLLRRNAPELPVSDERFSIPTVLERVHTESDPDELERLLERDYYILRYLLKYAADLKLASIENRMLMLDYRVMRLWYRAVHHWAPGQARKALVEMASALGAVARKASLQTEEIA